jgi:DNA-binding XRE family transcriptional regulator
MSLAQPTPEQIRLARTAAGHTQAEAAELVHAARRSWEAWESTSPGTATRAMPLASWELYLLKSGQHPQLVIAKVALSSRVAPAT